MEASPIVSPVAIRRLESVSEAEVGQLADILVDCVVGGASVSFLLPLSRARAEGFWRKVADAVQRGERILLVAEDEQGLVGTVQVILDLPENQPHRGDVAKMLVHRRGRKRGIGKLLLRAAEDAAKAAGRTLLVLDTVTGSDGDRLYARNGWQRVGEIPRYALWPDGKPCPTTYYFKDLR